MVAYRATLPPRRAGGCGRGSDCAGFRRNVPGFQRWLGRRVPFHAGRRGRRSRRRRSLNARIARGRWRRRRGWARRRGRWRGSRRGRWGRRRGRVDRLGARGRRRRRRFGVRVTGYHLPGACSVVRARLTQCRCSFLCLVGSRLWVRRSVWCAKLKSSLSRRLTRKPRAKERRPGLPRTPQVNKCSPSTRGQNDTSEKARHCRGSTDRDR